MFTSLHEAALLSDLVFPLVFGAKGSCTIDSLEHTGSGLIVRNPMDSSAAIFPQTLLRFISMRKWVAPCDYRRRALAIK